MEIIHIVLGKANPSRMNGVNKVVFQLATEQAKAGKKVSVWGITKNLTQNYGERVFETCLFKAQKNPFGISRELRNGIIAKKGLATFHLHGGWVPVFYQVSSVLSRFDIPFIFTPHGAYNTIAMQRSKISKNLYFRLFEKPLLKRALRIHCIGESEITGLHGIFPNDKAMLTPYGFKANAQMTALKDKDVKNFIIGFVGRLDIYTKGLDLLLEAFESFVAHDEGARLWIVGDSHERKVLQQEVARRKMQDKVVFWGSKFGYEKDALMEQMHVFAHPSRNEGLPASVLEASSMGIPCLVTKATNVGEVIGNYEAGMAVEDENKIALENALYVLRKQWSLDKLVLMGKNARRMVNEEFNWKHIVGKFDKLYQA